MYYAIQGKAYEYRKWQTLFNDCDNPQVFSTREDAVQIADWYVRQTRYKEWKIRVVKVDIVVKPYTEQ